MARKQNKKKNFSAKTSGVCSRLALFALEIHIGLLWPRRQQLVLKF
jgi:hypothetical protein